MNVQISPAPLKGGEAIPLDLVVDAHRNLVQLDRPVALRLRIAKGLLPSTMEDLVPTLAYLRHDADREVRSAATETLSTMPGEELAAVVGALHSPHILDTLARTLPHDIEPTMRVATNRNTADPTLLYLCGVGGVRLCDTIGRNAVRCLARPPLIEALFFNPRAPQGVVQNLMELAVREDLPLDHMPGYAETRSALLGERRFQEDDGPGLGEIDFLTAMEFAFDDVGAKEEEEEEGYQTRNLATLIGRMTVAQKIRLALVGDAGSRKLLIRDPKKMVALAVLKSPRLTDGEIKAFCTNKALADEVISTIARRRAWTRDYRIRKALLMNPKTPVGFAMSFLRSMNKADIRMLAKSRDAPPVVARQAQRILSTAEAARRRKRKR